MKSHKLLTALADKLLTSGATSPLGMVTSIHAIDRLQLQPGAKETKKWVAFFGVIKPFVVELDPRSLCTVFHAVSLCIQRTFRHSQVSPLPAEGTKVMAEMQQLLEELVDQLEPGQLFVLLQSLNHLRNSGLINNGLYRMAQDRAPILTPFLKRPKDFIALVRVVAGSEQEWREATVVGDVVTAANRHLPELSHQDLLLLVDALTSRNVIGTSITIRPIPSPLMPLFEVVCTAVRKKQRELSPSQLAAWLTRFVDHHRAAALQQGNEDTSTEVKMTDAQKSVIAFVCRRLGVTAVAQGLSDNALKVVALSLHKIWTPLKQQSEHRVGDDGDDVTANPSEGVPRALPLALGEGYGASLPQCMVTTTTLIREMLRRCHLELSVSSQRRLSDSACDGLLSMILSIPEPFWFVLRTAESRNNGDDNIARAVRDAVCLVLKATSPPTAPATPNEAPSDLMRTESTGATKSAALPELSPRQESELLLLGNLHHKSLGLPIAQLFERFSSCLDCLPLLDLVFVFNELATQTFDLQRSDRFANPRELKAFLAQVHTEVLKRRSKGSLSTGQLVRYLSSMSKLSFKKKKEYSIMMQFLRNRRLTPFELVRLAGVVSRHGVQAPVVKDYFSHHFEELRSTLTPTQKALLLKALGQMSYRWEELPPHEGVEWSSAGDVQASNSPTSVSLTTAADDWLLRPTVSSPQGRRHQRSQQNRMSTFSHTEDASRKTQLSWFLTNSGLTSAPWKLLPAIQLINGLYRLGAFTLREGSAHDSQLPFVVSSIVEQIQRPALLSEITGANTIAEFVASLPALTDFVTKERLPIDLWLVALESLCARAPHSRSPFADFYLLSQSWHLVVGYFTSDTGIDYYPAHLKNRVRELVERCESGIRSVLVPRLIDIAANSNSNTFLFAQVRCGAAFQCHALGVDDNHIRAWCKLLALMPVAHLPFVSASNPHYICDTAAVLAAMVSWLQTLPQGGEAREELLRAVESMKSHAAAALPQCRGVLRDDQYKFAAECLQLPVC